MDAPQNTDPLDDEALDQIVRICTSRDLFSTMNFPPGQIWMEGVPLAVDILMERCGMQLGPELTNRDGEPLLGRWRGGGTGPRGQEPLNTSQAISAIADILRRAGAEWPGEEIEGPERLIPALQSLLDRMRQ